MEVFVGFRGQSRAEQRAAAEWREKEEGRERGNGSASWNNKSSEEILEMKRNSWKESTHTHKLLTQCGDIIVSPSSDPVQGWAKVRFPGSVNVQ